MASVASPSGATPPGPGPGVLRRQTCQGETLLGFGQSFLRSAGSPDSHVDACCGSGDAIER